MNRRVLVTGAASGLGAALARRFVAAGDRVLLTDVTPGVTNVTLEDDRVAYERLDVRSDEDWARARDWCEQHWGGLDLLVNKAGSTRCRRRSGTASSTSTSRAWLAGAARSSR